MPRIIKDTAIIDDQWTLVDKDILESGAELPAGDVIVPLQYWLQHKETLLQRDAKVGVWLDSDEDTADIAADLRHLELVAVNFPVFSDGRGFTLGRQLRERYGFQGELRAIGDVLVDPMFYMKRCGFNAFAVRADLDIEDALKGLTVFTETYQASIDQPLPLFRRRAS